MQSLHRSALHHSAIALLLSSLSTPLLACHRHDHDMPALAELVAESQSIYVGTVTAAHRPFPDNMMDELKLIGSHQEYRAGYHVEIDDAEALPDGMPTEHIALELTWCRPGLSKPTRGQRIVAFRSEVGRWIVVSAQEAEQEVRFLLSQLPYANSNRKHPTRRSNEIAAPPSPHSSGTGYWREREARGMANPYLLAPIPPRRSLNRHVPGDR